MMATASAPRFKQFPFFDQSPVKDVHDLGSSPHILQNAAEISTTASSSVGALVADIHGSVHVLDREFEPALSWVAHVGGRVTHMEERKGILVTLGEEDTVSYPLLKVWTLEKTDKNGFPVLLRSVKVQHASRRTPVSCIALANGLAALAVGLGDGTVLLYRHFDQSIFSSSTSLTAISKPRAIHDSATEPATGLGFREPTAETPSLYLFIATTNRVLSYQVSGRGSGASPIEVHEVGAPLNCAAIDWRAHDLFVAREEAIYVCGVEGRGSSFALEGPKLFVRPHRNYLVIVTPTAAPSAGSASLTIRNAVARGAANGEAEIGKTTVFDPENKFVAFSDTFQSGIRTVLSQWNNLYILTNNGALFCLQEKPTPEKLGMLYQRQQHPLALSIAKTQNLDEASVADIHRQYGDHLYSRGDYDGAMQQYLQTIGHVQPSYVIRKFLDAQRIHNLVTYLQELHALGIANADHTTLLLNTYTKLKDVTRLDSFIKTESRRGDDTDELPFDLDTAIRVCRQAGYFEHASYLAKRWERHEDYLRIQIEDAGNYKEALMYLRRLGPNAAEHSLARYGRKMLEALPHETTQLLIDICTNPALLTAEPEELTPTPVKQGPSYLSYLALNRGSSSEPPPPSATSEATAAPKKNDSNSRKGSVHESSRASTPPPGTPTSAQPSRPTLTILKRPSPRLYFANFVGHRAAFVTFLETVARRRWGQALDTPNPTDHIEAETSVDDAADRTDQAAVWNTLLELYLSEGLNNKAHAVLESSRIPYDPAHALILCTTRGYTRGLVLLWERLGMHEDVLRFWMDRARSGEAGAGAEVMRCLEEHAAGSAGRYLYPLVLRFLTESPDLMSRHRVELDRVLRTIQERGIMPPLAVVQVLSRNGVASVGAVKEWLLGRIHEARGEIETDQHLIDSYRVETNSKLKKIAELSDPDHPRNFHATQCSSCGGQLDLPSIHFMCGHSYHSRCLVNNETECPICARDHAMIRDIRRNNERLADQHDVFVAEVQESGFSAIAAGFGRGVFNLPRSENITAR